MLYTKCEKWIHGRYAKRKRVTASMIMMKMKIKGRIYWSCVTIDNPIWN